MTWTTIRYEREKLYDEIWIEPVSKVALRYGISGVALRKICQKLAVPLPARGYWARVEAGRPPRKPALPKFSGQTVIVRSRFVSDTPPEPVPPEPEHLLARRQFEARPEHKIKVPDELVDPHPMVVSTEKSLRRSKFKDSRGWPYPGARRALDVAVSEESVPRALRILDALIKALADRGLPCRVENVDSRCTYVNIQNEKIEFRLLEKAIRTERALTTEEKASLKKYGHAYIPNRYSYGPSGALALCYNGNLTIGDGKVLRLEDRLNEFIVGLEVGAVRRKNERVRREREKVEWERIAQLHREQEERRREEQEKLKQLENEASQWRRASDIRAYALAAETAALARHGSIAPESEMGRWLLWARRQANSIDPLVANEH